VAFCAGLGAPQASKPSPQAAENQLATHTVLMGNSYHGGGSRWKIGESGVGEDFVEQDGRVAVELIWRVPCA